MFHLCSLLFLLVALLACHLYFHVRHRGMSLLYLVASFTFRETLLLAQMLLNRLLTASYGGVFL